jgi:hypothetical protein
MKNKKLGIDWVLWLIVLLFATCFLAIIYGLSVSGKSTEACDKRCGVFKSKLIRNGTNVECFCRSNNGWIIPESK